KSTVSASELMRHIIEHIEIAQTVYKLKDKNAPYWHVIPKIDAASGIIENIPKVDKPPKQHTNLGVPEILLRNNQLLRGIAIDLNPT
ncbi:17560_t:CDS:2, partial [Acaulospora morrowiae]